MRLRHRHHRFVEEYLVDLDQGRAAIRAGFPPREARKQADRLLRRPEIAALVAAAMDARARRTGITIDRVLREYARLAFADMRDVAQWGPDGATLRDGGSLSDAAAATIAELVARDDGDGVAVQWRLFDKESALDGIARLLGLYAPAALMLEPRALEPRALDADLPAAIAGVP